MRHPRSLRRQGSLFMRLVPACAAAAMGAAAGAGPGGLNEVRISEIRIGGCGGGPLCTQGQQSLRYVELEGPPGTPLTGVWYVVLGRGADSLPTATGNVELALSLQGGVIGADGRFLITGSTHPVLSCHCSLLGPPDLEASACLPGIEPDENLTHLLVRSNVPIQAGIDLDRNNDCVLDSPPWTGVMDVVRFVSAGGPPCEGYYPGLGHTFEPAASTVCGASMGLPPRHVFRCEPYGTWLAAEDFFQLFPGGADTPGQRNLDCLDMICPGDGPCCDAHPGQGCEDDFCCNKVCINLPDCCLVSWDQACADLAQVVCACGGGGYEPRCPDDPSLGSCFTAQATPGCEDFLCALIVCNVDPACCDTVWDVGCAQQALASCVCGNPTRPACTFIHAQAGCSECDCCRRVCLIDESCCAESWDAFCVALAAQLCQYCGDPTAGSCCIDNGTPGCDDFDCCQQVCGIDSFCCDLVWDFSCALMAVDLCEGCAACGDVAAPVCFAAHDGPGCSDPVCCVAVCGFDLYCCELQWDFFCAEEAFYLCSGLQECLVLPPTVSCFLEQKGPGCGDTGCCEVVCANDPNCCAVLWDQSCADMALDLCLTRGCGDPFGNGCLQPADKPGCAFEPCCQTVCALDPSCCTSAWDADCAELALGSCCGLPQTGSCFDVHGSPFCKSGGCCMQVCQVDPFCCNESWDFGCVAAAFELCAPQCTDDLPGIRACYIPHDTPGCDDPDLCNDVCLTDPYCCVERWDAVCVQIAAAIGTVPGCPGPGGCIEGVDFASTGCSNVNCCNAVCSFAAACCTVSWDGFCTMLAELVCSDLLAWPFPPVCPGEGSPFTVHDTPGSEDETCCRAVCAVDAFCCEVSWDSGCVMAASSLCNDFLPPFCFPSAFSCLTPHGEPFCVSANCSDIVCAADAFCCEIAWDIGCVGLALDLCGIGCGGMLSGDCLTATMLPGCRDWDCCQRVCDHDPFCCSVVWDSQCVGIAVDFCPLGSCFVSHASPGCENPEYAFAVCQMDPECCEFSWDADCVALAQELFLPAPPKGRKGPGGCSGPDCLPVCGDSDAGDCFTAHLTPSCDDDACCDAVCQQSPFCCENAWDQGCVDFARTFACSELWQRVTPGPGDPCAGSCFLVTPTPYCDDADCVMQVCMTNDFCCQIQWDQFCVTLALSFCRECGDPTTGDCCTPHGSPYCNDESCCLMVCLIDPSCCAVGGVWDNFCVQQAFLSCPGVCVSLECGDLEAGDCCSQHGNPFCSDESCCEDVCDLDELCCLLSWDQTCVNLAQQVCPQCDQTFACGDPDAGSCFEAHLNPACNDFECCEFVCSPFADPTCCEIVWDAECAAIAVKFCP